MKFADLNIPASRIRSFAFADDVVGTVVLTYRDPDTFTIVSARVDEDSDLLRALGMHLFAQAHGLTNVPQRADFYDVDLAEQFRWMIGQNIVGLSKETVQRIQGLGTDLGNLILAATEELDRLLTGDSIAGDLSWMPERGD